MKLSFLAIVLAVMWAHAPAQATTPAPCENVKKACQVCYDMPVHYCPAGETDDSNCKVECSDAEFTNCNTAAEASTLAAKIQVACPTLDRIAPQYREADEMEIDKSDRTLIVVVNVVVALAIFAGLIVVACLKCRNEKKP